eukprot:782065-Pelagomonas_calceolata.AAC.6
MQVQISARRARNALCGSNMSGPRNLMAPPPKRPQHLVAQKRGEGEGQEKCLGVGAVCAEAGEQSRQQQCRACGQ